MLAVKDGSPNMGPPASLKREILFFDRILLLNADEAIWQWRNSIYSDSQTYSYASDIEYLIGTDYFQNVEISRAIKHLPNPKSLEEKDFNSSLDEFFALNERIEDINPTGTRVSSDENPAVNQLPYLASLQKSMMTRLVALERTIAGEQAVSSYRVPLWALEHALKHELKHELKHGPEPRVAEVIQLLMKRVPVPSEKMSWQDVLELKQDSELTKVC